MPSTERLLLRQWTEQDKEPFAALNADPEVMEHFPSTLTREESDAMVDRLSAAIAADGWGLWAVEPHTGPDAGRLAGFVGIHPLGVELPPAPAVEVGWRLARWSWSRGYASEAARTSLDYGFGTLGLDEIVSITAVPNVRSQAVMRRLGMRHVPERDFDNPRLPPGHRLERHVLYAISRPTRP